VWLRGRQRETVGAKVSKRERGQRESFSATANPRLGSCDLNERRQLSQRVLPTEHAHFHGDDFQDTGVNGVPRGSIRGPSDAVVLFAQEHAVPPRGRWIRIAAAKSAQAVRDVMHARQRCPFDAIV